MQRLPYVVVTNRHISDVYELYYTAFDTFRRVKEIKTLDDNDKFCSIIASMLRAHLSVIPKLAMGILECNGLMPAANLDRFMNTILRSVRAPCYCYLEYAHRKDLDDNGPMSILQQLSS